MTIPHSHTNDVTRVAITDKQVQHMTKLYNSITAARAFEALLTGDLDRAEVKLCQIHDKRFLRTVAHAAQLLSLFSAPFQSNRKQS